MPNLRLPYVLALAGLCLAIGLPTVAAADDNYGAIAFSTDSGAHGYSYDFGSRGEAEERALQECGSGCEVVLWFKNSCGALAAGEGNGYGTAWAGNREAAEDAALRVCAQNAGNCSVKAWACTTR
jgi:Domain of unknown function (DUF4189)